MDKQLFLTKTDEKATLNFLCSVTVNNSSVSQQGEKRENTSSIKLLVPILDIAVRTDKCNQNKV